MGTKLSSVQPFPLELKREHKNPLQDKSLCYLSANHPCSGVVIARMDYTPSAES